LELVGNAFAAPFVEPPDRPLTVREEIFKSRDSWSLFPRRSGRWSSPGGGFLCCVAFGFGLSLGFDIAFCSARFEMLIDDVLKPSVLTVVATTWLKRPWKLFLSHKPVDMLTRIFDPFAGQVRKAENAHRDAPVTATNNPSLQGTSMRR
jgi:hypothetical protein